MTQEKNKESESSFEQAIQELETIVRLMEEGNLELDEALAKFEEGIRLSRFCSRKLVEAEQKIDFLLRSEDGRPFLQPAVAMEEGNE